MATTSNIDGVYRALGVELTKLHGTVSTRLTAPLAAGAVVASVESTLGFPSVGVVYIDGERIAYASLAEGVFAGLTRDAVEARSHRVGAEVADGSRSLSQMDKLRSDQLVTRAEGRALDRYGWRHGERRPLLLDDDDYRGLLRTLLYLERGTWWALFRVLRACLAPWVRNGTATTDAGQPNRLAGAPADFSEQDVGRPLVVGERVYRIREVAADGSYADLQPGRGYWWCAGNFGDGSGCSYMVLPFRIFELPDQAPGEVLIDVTISSDRTAPPSYLIWQITALPPYTPVGWPLGSQALTDENVDGATYYPWYLPGLPEEEAFYSILEEVVPAGVNVRVTVTAAGGGGMPS